MQDLVRAKLSRQKGIGKMLLASALPNFRQVKDSGEAKPAARQKNAIVYCPAYELDDGVYNDVHRNGGAVVFAFCDLLRENGFRRAIMLSKMRLAFACCRRSGADFAVCSLANEGNEARNARELEAFCAVLGMTQHEKSHAEKTLARLTAKKK
ncbi:Uncharacterised protein [uncultured archaeon]|nr:Uncharacterised protein [uncultured archaeon]